MNARMVRKAISVAFLTAAVGLAFEHSSAPRAEPFRTFGKAFDNNPRKPKTGSSSSTKKKVEATPNPESPYYNGAGQGYVATPPAVPPVSGQPATAYGGEAVPGAALPVQYRPGQPVPGQTLPGQPVVGQTVPGQGTVAQQQQQMQAQQMWAAQQYAQQQAAQQQMAQQQALAQQQMGAPQPSGAVPAAGQDDSTAAVHDYVAEMYRRDGREIPQWDYQAMGYNPQPVYRQQGAQGASAPKQPSFLQRWAPGIARFLPGKSDPVPQQARTGGQPTNSAPGQPAAGQPQYAPQQYAPQQYGAYGQALTPGQPQTAQPQFAQPQYAQPQYGGVPQGQPAAQPQFAPQQPQVPTQPQFTAQPQYAGQPQYAPQQPAVVQQPPQPYAGQPRPGSAAPPVVGRVGVPIGQPAGRLGAAPAGPALVARPGTPAATLDAPQPLPQPTVPGFAPQTGAPASETPFPSPANVAATPGTAAPAPQLPVLDIAAEPARTSTVAKPLGDDFFADEAAADKAAANQNLTVVDDKAKAPAPAAPAAAPLLADEPAPEAPKENPYTGRKLLIDERVGVKLPDPAASLLDDEMDEDRKLLLAQTNSNVSSSSTTSSPDTPSLPSLDVGPAPNTSTTTSPSLAEGSPKLPELSPPDQPTNDREETERPKLEARPTLKGFKGFCPVTLRNSRRLVEAKPEFSTAYAGLTYQFATAEAKAEFDAAPERFVPAKDGRDVVQAAASSEAAEGSLDHAVWYRGRLYMFASETTREEFVAAPTKFAVP